MASGMSQAIYPHKISLQVDVEVLEVSSFLLDKPVPNVFSLSSTRRVSIGWCATGCRGGQPRRIAMKVGDGSSNKFRLRNQIKKSSTALIFFRTTWYTWAPRIWMVNQLTAIFSTKTAIIHRWYTMNRPLSDTYIVSQTEDSLSWSWPSYGYCVILSKPKASK